MRHKPDAIDVDLLKILQTKGRTKRGDLAQQVGLSISSASERLRKLEEMGIIRGYHALLDSRMLGLELTAFVAVTADSSRRFKKLIELATECEEVVECHAITGDGSHLLKVRTKNTESLERLLSLIQSWPGVVNTKTSIVLSTPKENTAISLQYLQEDVEKK